MIFVGIDDTDSPDSRGTNQLARRLVDALATDWACIRIVRHQLLEDPRVPCTSKNGSASIMLKPQTDRPPEEVVTVCRDVMLEDFVEGSDPGLCMAIRVPAAVEYFGRRCKKELVTSTEARNLAWKHGIYLEGLGGTEDGIIGALAAVGLAASGLDGRVVRWMDWADDLTGPQPVTLIADRGIEVRDIDTDLSVTYGTVDLGKKLRPNMFGGHPVLFVRPDPTGPDRYAAIKLP
ncbi:ABC transporter substrate-binding protein [Maioricimonas sp. JC845]|uniref:ABC transporter substrate-binding protein n=1 Tax=Maioricimonas sp. JC845 TaxID=3232138 RepID=UPI003457E5C9